MSILRRKFLSLFGGALIASWVGGCGKNKSVKMLAFADIHCDDDRADDGLKDYQKSFAKLQNALSQTKNEHFDCVLNLGDIVEGEILQYEKVESLLAKANAPLKNVLGNHDLRCSPNSQRNMINRLFDGGKSYYHFDMGNWRFFVLDSLRISRVSKIKDEQCAKETAYWLEKAKGKENGVVWGGGIDSTQLKWLDDELKIATAQNKNVAVFCHMAIFPFSHASIFNHEQVAEVLENNKCVKAFICGHKHTSDYVVHKGVHYLTLMSLLEHKPSTFATLEFSDNKIVVKGYGEELSRELKF